MSETDQTQTNPVVVEQTIKTVEVPPADATDATDIIPVPEPAPQFEAADVAQVVDTPVDVDAAHVEDVPADVAPVAPAGDVPANVTVITSDAAQGRRVAVDQVQNTVAVDDSTDAVQRRLRDNLALLETAVWAKTTDNDPPAGHPTVDALVSKMRADLKLLGSRF